MSAIVRYLEVVHGPYAHHTRMHTQARVRVPWWIHPFFRLLWFIWDSCAEKQGTIIRIEKDPYNGKLLYTLRFRNADGTMDRNYFEEGIEFVEPANEEVNTS
jgi:hypothetical protein